MMEHKEKYYQKYKNSILSNPPREYLFKSCISSSKWVNEVISPWMLIVWTFLKPLCGLEELRKLVLRHVHLPGVHELQDRGQMLNKYDMEIGVPNSWAGFAPLKMYLPFQKGLQR